MILATSMLWCSASAWAGQPLFTGVADMRGKANATMTASKAAQRPENMSVRAMRANPNVVSAKTSEIELDLGLDRVNAVLDRIEPSADGSTVWIGHVRETSKRRTMTPREVRHDENNSVVLVRRGKGVTGTVRVKGKLYRIQPLPGGDHAVIEVREKALPPEHPSGPLPEGGGPAAPRRMMTALAVSPGVTDTIRVLVVATNEAVMSYGGDMQALADTAIAESNQGFINANAGIKFELAGYSTVAYTTAGMNADLTRFAGTTDGYMDDIHALRDSSGADLAVLVGDDNSSCGLGYLNASASTAFSTVHWSCMTGYYTFAHEIGHNMGARHDPVADPNDTPYAYGHGYRAPNNAWRTIMAYDCSTGCTRLNYWSNPDVTYDGVSMGTADRSHNQRVLVENKARVAAFRADAPRILDLLALGSPQHSESAGTVLKYRLDVPYLKSLNILTTGGVTGGNADLYVKYGSEPTETSYDCRPLSSSSSEVCLFKPTKAGSYYIMIKATKDFANVSLAKSYEHMYENTFVKPVAQYMGTTEAPIEIADRAGNANARTPVKVDIRHARIGDLKVELVAPSGRAYVLHDRSGGDTADLGQSYWVDLSSEPMNGTWKLQVNDNVQAIDGGFHGWWFSP